MEDKEILRRAEASGDIGLSFSGRMSREQVMARLLAAQRVAIAAAPTLLSDEFKFKGDEIMGPRR